jgi:hypothetical protein
VDVKLGISSVVIGTALLLMALSATPAATAAEAPQDPHNYLGTALRLAGANTKTVVVEQQVTGVLDDGIAYSFAWSLVGTDTTVGVIQRSPERDGVFAAPLYWELSGTSDRRLRLWEAQDSSATSPVSFVGAANVASDPTPVQIACGIAGIVGNLFGPEVGVTIGTICFLTIFTPKLAGDSFWYDNAPSKYLQADVRGQTYSQVHSYVMAYYGGAAMNCYPDFRQWDLSATCHQMNSSFQLVNQNSTFRSEIQWPDGYVGFEQFAGGSRVYTQNAWYPPGTSANDRELTLPLGHYRVRVGVSVAATVHPGYYTPGFHEGAGVLLYDTFIVPAS